MTDIPLVLLLGILSTIQTHLAKALERQGIEVFEQIKARLQKSGKPVDGGLKKPLIYTIGLILNQTVFVWAILAGPYGPPALFTSMFGMGLVFLMVYAAVVMKEPVTLLETAGAVAIVGGTLAIGIENISRSGLNSAQMDVNAMLVVLAIWCAAGLAFVVLVHRTRSLSLVALAYGLLAGGLGGLDPFLKAVGQHHGGTPSLLPSSLVGTILFAASFVTGFLAFLVTQFGFAKKVRASLLIPAYNAAYIGLPALLQAFLLPGYRTGWPTVLGILLILAGMVGMQAFKKQRRPVQQDLPALDRS